MNKREREPEIPFTHKKPGIKVATTLMFLQGIIYDVYLSAYNYDVLLCNEVAKMKKIIKHGSYQI